MTEPQAHDSQAPREQVVAHYCAGDLLTQRGQVGTTKELCSGLVVAEGPLQPVLHLLR